MDEVEERRKELKFKLKRKEAMRRLDQALAELAKQEGKQPSLENTWPEDWK